MPKEGGLRNKGFIPQSAEGLPLISVVTVVYNGAKYLRQAIESVVNQDYPNLEYIVIDGGSTDGTLGIVQEYEHKISYWVSEKDRGIYDAMNKGIMLCTGELIGTKNADDFYAPGALRAVADTYLQTSAEVIFGNTLKLWDDDESKTSLIISDVDGLMNRTTVDHRTVFIKTALHKENLFDLRYRLVADYHLLLKLQKQGCRFVSTDKVISYMRSGGASDTAKVYLETKQVHNELFGQEYAERVYRKNMMAYYTYRVKNRILKLFLGEKGIAKFKARKSKG